MKNKFKISSFIFIVIISFVFSLFSEPIYQANAAEWYDETWSYRKEITLAPATTAANYQVKIELTAANFDYTKAKANGEDLRFTASDGITLQNYWIETWVNGGTSIIWVKVVILGTSNIYMYYGNATATDKSTENTFEFFDSFDDGDVSDWTAATYYQTIASSSSVDSSCLTSPEYSFKMYAKANCWNAPYSGAEIRMSKTIALPNGNYIADFYQKFIGTRDRACAWGNTSNYLYFYINNTIRFTRNCSGACTAIITCDTQSSTSDFFQITTGSAKISLSARPTDCAYSTSWFDDVRIRKYASPEPVASVKGEFLAPVCEPGLVPCGRRCDVTSTTNYKEDDPCTLCHLILMVQLIIDFLVKIAAVIAAFFLAIAGFMYIFSAGKPELLSSAKTIFKTTLIGFALIFIAWIMVDTILTMFGFIDPLGDGNWHVMC